MSIQKTLVLSVLLAGTAHAGVKLPEGEFRPFEPVMTACFSDFAYFRDRIVKVIDPDFKPEDAPLVSFLPEEKKAMKEAIVEHFSDPSLGFTVRVSGDCTWIEDSRTIIIAPYINDFADGLAGTVMKNGARGLLMHPLLKRTELGTLNPVYAKRNLSLKDQMKSTLVHELLHDAGLAHEEDSAEPGCLALSSPDPQSIMSVEYLVGLHRFGFSWNTNLMTEKFAAAAPAFHQRLVDSRLSNVAPSGNGIAHQVKLGLSRGDRHSLRCIYSDRTGVDVSTCHSGFDPYKD